jgi:hypothetical protein
MTDTITPEITPDTTMTDDAWLDLLSRLNRQSVTKHFDAYADIDWDGEEMRLDPTDPRFELPPDEPLTRTEWYRTLPAETKARLACHSIASKMKIGLQFEGVLKRGLLEYASRLPNGSPEFRYAYHEVIEEARHALMFQEFVNRSGFDAAGLGLPERIGARFVIRLARVFPELFFVFVLGGEDPIDHVQRRALRRGDGHPLVERIMRIHVTEEARHLSFARHYLKRSVPNLPAWRRTVLAVGAPLVLSVMAELMLKPSRQLVKEFAIPADVVREAYTDNPEHRAQVIESLGKVRALCEEIGLLRRPFGRLWTALRLA